MAPKSTSSKVFVGLLLSALMAMDLLALGSLANNPSLAAAAATTASDGSSLGLPSGLQVTSGSDASAGQDTSKAANNEQQSINAIDNIRQQQQQQQQQSQGQGGKDYLGLMATAFLPPQVAQQIQELIKPYTGQISSMGTMVPGLQQFWGQMLNAQNQFAQVPQQLMSNFGRRR